MGSLCDFLLDLVAVPEYGVHQVKHEEELKRAMAWVFVETMARKGGQWSGQKAYSGEGDVGAAAAAAAVVEAIVAAVIVAAAVILPSLPSSSLCYPLACLWA